MVGVAERSCATTSHLELRSVCSTGEEASSRVECPTDTLESPTRSEFRNEGGVAEIAWFPLPIDFTMARNPSWECRRKQSMPLLRLVRSSTLITK